MTDRELDIEVNTDNQEALEGAHEWLSKTSDATLMGDD